MRLKNLKACHILDLRSISSALTLLRIITKEGKLREINQTKKKERKINSNRRYLIHKASSC
jgi:hypothetical protein